MRLLTLAAALSILASPGWAQAPSPAAKAAAGMEARAAMPAKGDGKVDINSAPERQLEALNGIGPVRAKAIVAKRPYEELQDLVKKKVLTQGLLDGAKAGMALANVNTSSAKDMEMTLPGIAAVKSKAIVAGRPYKSLDDLAAKGVLTEAAVEKIKPVAAY